jgi:hypothetical protein
MMYPSEPTAIEEYWLKTPTASVVKETEAEVHPRSAQ